jgi:DNA polymerase epsilon subunit 1
MLMKKMFLFLVKELRDLGSRIVYASFNKIIICTNKCSLESAQSYSKYILDTILNKNMFAFLKIQPKIYWSQLVLLDQENFGGALLLNVDNDELEGDDDSGLSGGTETKRNVLEDDGSSDNEGDLSAEDFEGMDDDADDDDILVRKSRRKVLDDDSDSEIDDTMGTHQPEEEGSAEDVQLRKLRSSGPADDLTTSTDEAEGPKLEKPNIVSHWNIAEYLPDYVQDYFWITVGEFIYKPLHYRQRELHKQTLALQDAGPETAGAEHMSHSQMRKVEDDVNSKTQSYTQELVRSYWTKRLMTIVEELERSAVGESDFPLLAGSHLQHSKPALEFIKSVCHVLNLDGNVEDEVRGMKNSLLKFINERLFSEQVCIGWLLKENMCARNISFGWFTPHSRPPLLLACTGGF